MSRLTRLIGAMVPAAASRRAAALADVEASAAALQRKTATLGEEVSALSGRVLEARRRSASLVDAHRQDAETRIAIAGLPRARLLSDAVWLDGSPSQRLRVRRRTSGRPVERPFRRSLGVTRGAGAATDVQALWERLLAFEAACGDDLLHALPCAVLDIPGGAVAAAGGTLRVTLRPDAAAAPSGGTGDAPGRRVIAVPRCAYAFPERKLRNFGHWLLDCVPQVVALSALAPDAMCLLPQPLREFQRATLRLAGVADERMVPWDGAAVRGERLLVLESDGRTGGGRPLSPLIELRRLLAPGLPASPGRKIYVSRRDAKPARRWLNNEPAVEALFARRGFEVLVMAECPLADQVRIFREAAVVAGISGAGLADIIFSPPGTHVIALLTDSLVRWYADEAGARSLWASGERSGGGQLAALGDSPRFYAHLAAAFDQRCHSFVTGDAVAIDALGAFLDEVLARVEPA